MMDFQEILATIECLALRNNPVQEQDYRRDDGLLMCGDCHTPREYYSDKFDKCLPISCTCKKEQQKKEDAMAKEKEDIRVIRTLKENSLMEEKFRGATFENFKETQENSYNLKVCKRYATGFSEMVEKNQGLLLFGGPGTGKTYAAACIANHLMKEKKAVVMTTFIHLIDRMQDFKNKVESDEAFLNRLNRAKLLIIDDLGSERSTDFALEKVYATIDSRYRKKLPIVITSNHSIDALKQEKDIRFARIYDRIFEMCHPMEFTGFSFRKAAAVRREQEMKLFLEQGLEFK